MIMQLCRAMCLAILFGSIAAADEVKTLSGKSVVGTVVSLSDSVVLVKTPKGEEKVPLAQVLAVELRPAKGMGTEKYSDVRLLDDTVLHCTKVVLKGKDVQLTLPSGTALSLPVNYVVSIWHEAQNAPLRKKWEELLAQRVKKDRIVVVKDGELNPLEGTIGEVDAEGKTVQFRRETGDVLPITLDRLNGMVFHRLEVPTTSPVCKVIDTQGNTLMAVKVAFDGKKYQVTTSFAANVSLDPEALARLDFNMGKLTYLARPEKEPKAGTGIAGEGYVRDLADAPIAMDGQNFGRGVWARGPIELEYNLDGKFKEFKAFLGVHPDFSVESKAVVTIFCDGEKRFSESPAKAMRAIAVNVKDVTTLKIVVTTPDPFNNLHAQAVLAEARVSQ
ncbi:MAG: hypothetical protein FJ271_13770 [Planctomycetes bacterium]|nr:hypothetical protein [Planctomycetota bacterium]